MKLQSPAKINWHLAVGERRPDGYHELETIFQTISLADEIEIEPSRSFELQCNDPSIPTDDENLIARAWQWMKARFDIPPVSVRLDKKIPAGGGLGGGSSNAAVALRGLAQLFEVAIADAELASAALSLGSDVPFFLLGGSAYAIGRGEHLRKLPDAPSIPLLLLVPPVRIATAHAYQALAQSRALDGYRTSEPQPFEEWEEYFRGGALKHATRFRNDLERPVFEMIPQLSVLKERMREAGATWSAMSGSGSTIVGAFDSAEARDRARLAFHEIESIATETTIGLTAGRTE